MASSAHRDRVESYIAKGRGEARLVAGGGRPKGHNSGWFVEPTVFADVDNGAVIAQEEIFGPVLSIIRYGGDEAAVRIANASQFGLGGSVWSGDQARAIEVARRVESANAYVANAHPDCLHDCIFLICDSCGQTVHIDDDSLSGGVRQAAKSAGFTAPRPVIEVRGTCGDCEDS